MILRHLVPALGLAALTASTAFAADEKAPAYTFEGFSDNILTLNAPDDNRTGAGTNPTNTAKDDGAPSLRFTSTASLKANWKVADAVTARVNAWFTPGQSNSDAAAGAVNNNLNLRESYVVVGLGNGFSWQMGKAINHIGWLSAEPTGLYTVNATLINYWSTYGNDVIGTGLIYNDKDKSPVSFQLHITNGYATASDAINGPANAQRENSDLGIGFGATYESADKKVNIDFDFYYDMHSNANANGAGTALGGDVLLVGLNATLKPVDGLTLGAEVMMQQIGKSEAANGVKGNNGQDRIQGLLLANIAIPQASFPMSVTGLVQYVQIDSDTIVGAGLDKETRMEVAVALMTSPFTSKYFGLNLELAYYKIENPGFNSVATTVTASEQTGVNVSLEALASF